MKTKILFLLLLLPLFYSNSLQAQEDVFPRDSAIWVIHMYGDETPIQVMYGMQGDTLINDIIYSKLYLLNDSTLNIDEGDVFVAGIRQENKKVYVQPADKKDGTKFDEFLMYDFSKTIGDRVNFGKKPLMGWQGISSNDCPSCRTFENVDLERLVNIEGTIVDIIDDKFLISYDFVSFIADEWIKGIGSLSGLFFKSRQSFDLCGGCTTPSGCELICIKEKDEIKYLGEDCTSCFEEKFHYESGNIEKGHTQKLAEVSFNSSLNNIIIKSFAIPSTFQLVSVDGKLLTAFPINETEVIFNASTYPKGVYIYKIMGENIFQSGKLIIK